MDERRQSTTKDDEQTSETVTVAHDDGGHNDGELEEALGQNSSPSSLPQLLITPYIVDHHTSPHLTSPSACRLLSPLVTPTLFLAVSLSLEDSLPLLHLAGFTVCPSTSSSWLRVSRRRRRVSCVTAAVPPLRRCCGAASPSLESASSRLVSKL
ncbi:hypothetical protein Ahy_B10g102513 isoform C [Arachis hypogaea]|uniref:Uncharacterized protein n=1 Tax=Arachis hypogaea TaxID=3818 RepID=A0A444X1Z1_ARAHY|nr:hypothetical protein Ahy_B10g102513 isoform C [Arachis hypogaea]